MVPVRAGLRSVDSECESCVNELRKRTLSGPSSSIQRGQHQGAVMARRQGPAGVFEQGKHTRVAQEPGRAAEFHLRDAEGVPGYGLQARLGSIRPIRERRTGCTVVPPSRGTTKAERDDSAAVLATNSTREAGGVTRATPWREGVAGSWNRKERTMAGRPSPNNISTKLRRIATLAKQMPDAALTTLAHHIDVEFLEEAHRQTRKDGAVGVDGETADEYAEDLPRRLEVLLNRAKLGDLYRAPPVRRVYIPKDDGKRRPLGIPTFEDKILQRAVKMVMEAVYEQDFLPCSYGFRPGRSAHQAVETIWEHSMSMNGGWLLDIDIKSFFDSVNHEQLMAMIRERVRDGVILRLIGKWLKAGVMEEGAVYYPEKGTPQGGVISPLLANIYLHVVVDVWFEEQVKPRLVGRAELVRYADDMVMLFENEVDAGRVMEVIPKRLQRYSLELHPEKTRLVRFVRPPRNSKPRGPQRPETFDFLGFTHYWGRSRRGNWVIKRKTRRSRLTRALRRIAGYCRKYRHDPVRKQRHVLAKKMLGHYGYYGITGNYQSLANFYLHVQRIWHKWLSRRLRKAYINWERMSAILRTWRLPPPRIVHSCVKRVANP